MAKEVKLDANGFRKFGMVDKLAYAAGDFGCNMSFALKGTLSVFWLQCNHIDQGLLTFLVLLVQVWDAINDPVIGAMVDGDRRQYKRNKFLQYIWIGSIGLVIAGAACFIPLPNAPQFAKGALFIAGYVLWDAFYTVANVPYGSLLSLISNDAGDRAELSTWRSVGSMGGNILTGIALPMLIYDASNNLLGNRVFFVALIMGIIGFFCFQFMINKTEIRVQQDIKLKEEAPKFNVIQAAVRFFKNRAAVGATIAPVAQFIGMYAAMTANTVLWQAYFQNARISGLMSMISMLPMFLFIPFIRKLVGKFGKKESVVVGMIVSLVGYASLLVLPITPDNKGIAMWLVGNILAGIGGAVYTCVSWSLMADAMDYGEWKFNVREEGTTYAVHSFFRKLAQGVGPSLGLALCTMIGCNVGLGANQPLEVAQALRYLVPACYVGAGIVQLIGIGLVYNLDKKTVAKMNEELEARKVAK